MHATRTKIFTSTGIFILLPVLFLLMKDAAAQYFNDPYKGFYKNILTDSAHYNNIIPCLTCHVLQEAPGAQLTTVAGNANLCMSCHSALGIASATPFSNADKANPGISGTSHNWNMNPVSFRYGANTPSNLSMSGKLMDGKVVCSTCHEPHGNFYPPYLRISNSGDAMCKDCHSVRDVQCYGDNPQNKGSHPVGKIYPASDPRFYSSPQDPNILLINNRVECSSCHSTHYATSGNANNGTGDGFLLNAANSDNLCQTCHTYGQHQGMGCLTCHQSHDADRTNIYLVRDTVTKPGGGLAQVLLTSLTGPNSPADGDANYNGICEVCHTTTDYHRNNSSGNHTHFAGTNCMSCHQHSSDLAIQCSSCHTIPQDNGDGIPVGGRRAVMGEFPASNVHSHYGGTLDNKDCKVCHYLGNHMNGMIQLINPDNGAIISFLKPDSIHSDPDLSNFCMGCHDSNGAQIYPNPFDPFNSGNAPVNVASRFMGTLQWNEWYGDVCFGNEGTMRAVNSHHDISNADQAFSGAKIECLDCHGSHTVSASTPLIDPFNKTTAWTGTDNAFCLSCHNGGSGPLNPGFPAGVIGPTVPMRGMNSCNYSASPWYVDYTWENSAHGVSSKRGWPGYSGAPQYEVKCKDCHDPHGSYSATNTLGNPYMIRDVVNGTGYVDDGIRPGPQWTGPPWTVTGISREVKITISGTQVNWAGPTGLCNVCHASWLNSYSWHSSCNGCQTCHGHGQIWGEHDWGPDPDNSVPCAKKDAPEIKSIFQQEKPTILHLNQK